MNTVEKTSIKERLFAVFSQMMRESDILPKALRPVIEGLVKGYLQKATDEDIRKIILQIRKEFIPWLLDEQNEE